MTELPLREVSSVPPVSARSAVVLDLSGVESIEVGLAMATLGYRPVSLFNACPAPIVPGELVRTVVEVGPILHSLVAAAEALTRLKLPDDAPPVFLLDVNRTHADSPIAPGAFDNRSVVFASDFPSPAFLFQHGIKRAVVIHPESKPVGNDLRHALRHWKAAGLELRVVTPTGVPLDVRWPGNGFLGELALRLFCLFRLRRGVQGGFGAFVPEVSGG